MTLNEIASSSDESKKKRPSGRFFITRLRPELHAFVYRRDTLPAADAHGDQRVAATDAL